MLYMLVGTVILALGLSYFRTKRRGQIDPIHPMQSFDREWSQDSIPEPSDAERWPKA
ncbi:MAG TPA: hypothetical protein VJ850_07585 [Candidatus Limnocylindrales bacterium]|nr:hypothetical protein [Candidatus Limnocylindrales bacterium]